MLSTGSVNIGHVCLGKVQNGKVMVDVDLPRREHSSKVLRYYTPSQGISQFYLHTPVTC